jgi:hypothetical protein
MPGGVHERLLGSLRRRHSLQVDQEHFSLM